MAIKVFILFLFFVIFGSLASALISLVRDNDGSDRMVKALTLRIGLSIMAFVVLMAAYLLGFIQPHGIMPG